MLFYPLTSLITGMEKSNDLCVFMCVCVYNNSPSSPSRASISLGTPSRLPSDKVNKVCLACPACKYLFWKLPHPLGDTRVCSRVLRYIYRDDPEGPVSHMHTHVQVDPSPIHDPGQTFTWTSVKIHLNLAANRTSLGNIIIMTVDFFSLRTNCFHV